MADHRDLPMEMIGVGAAFDFLSGRKRQAPRALQGLGLEWLYRLAHEPGGCGAATYTATPGSSPCSRPSCCGSDGRSQ
jgi:UDP-N-acetyl-D-mannosaminuronic acid transferase (WecB/TagA/CpsF family)